jgi:hypothetical protein
MLIVLIANTAFFAAARSQEKTPAAVPTPMPTPQKLSAEITAVLSKMKFPVARFYSIPSMPSEPGFIEGMVGLDLFMGNVAVIDSPGKRLCMMPQADTPTEFVTKSQSTNFRRAKC